MIAVLSFHLIHLHTVSIYCLLQPFMFTVILTSAICKIEHCNSDEESDIEAYVLAYPRSPIHTNPFLS